MKVKLDGVFTLASKFEEIASDIELNTDVAFKRLLVDGQRQAKAKGPGGPAQPQNRFFKDKTGETRASIQYKELGSLHGAVFSNSKKAVWLEYGTKPHKIKARNAPQLVFFWEKMGTMFYGKSVNHPGTAPYGFMARAANYWELVAGQRIAETIHKVIMSHFPKAKRTPNKKK